MRQSKHGGLKGIYISFKSSPRDILPKNASEAVFLGLKVLTEIHKNSKIQQSALFGQNFPKMAKIQCT